MVVLLPRLLLLVLLLRLLVLAVWRWHRPAALLEGEADVVDVEGLLLERLLRELRLPVRVVVAEERQRLRHRDCWAVSSWWRTNQQRTVRRSQPYSIGRDEIVCRQSSRC